MAMHRSYSVEFKRQVAQKFLTSETLYGLAKRHDIEAGADVFNVGESLPTTLTVIGADCDA